MRHIFGGLIGGCVMGLVFSWFAPRWIDASRTFSTINLGLIISIVLAGYAATRETCFAFARKHIWRVLMVSSNNLKF